MISSFTKSELLHRYFASTLIKFLVICHDLKGFLENFVDAYFEERL